MDLSMISHKVNSGDGSSTDYESIETIIADFDLIVQNAIECAGVNDPLAEEARRIRAHFVKQLDALNARVKHHGGK